MSAPDIPAAGVPAVPMPVEEIELRGHLFMWHLQWTGDVKTLSGLIECHDDYEHGSVAPPVRMHVHAAPVTDREEEWTWT